MDALLANYFNGYLFHTANYDGDGLFISDVRHYLHDNVSKFDDAQRLLLAEADARLLQIYRDTEDRPDKDFLRDVLQMIGVDPDGDG